MENTYTEWFIKFPEHFISWKYRAPFWGILWTVHRFHKGGPRYRPQLRNTVYSKGFSFFFVYPCRRYGQFPGVTDWSNRAITATNGHSDRKKRKMLIVNRIPELGRVPWTPHEKSVNSPFKLGPYQNGLLLNQQSMAKNKDLRHGHKF